MFDRRSRSVIFIKYFLNIANAQKVFEQFLCCPVCVFYCFGIFYHLNNNKKTFYRELMATFITYFLIVVEILV